VERLIEEQKFGKLRAMLQELRRVDRKLAIKMRISVPGLEKIIQDWG
jgi:hypothetical protein